MKVIPAKKNIERSEADLNNSSDLIDEYGDLKFKLFVITLLLSGAIGLAVWGVYGANLALNYLLGAGVGVVYLRMLARGIDRLGNQGNRLGYSRFILFIVLIVVAARAETLHILPVFLGFMTYKAAILVYAIRDIYRVRST